MEASATDQRPGRPLSYRLSCAFLILTFGATAAPARAQLPDPCGPGSPAARTRSLNCLPLIPTDHSDGTIGVVQLRLAPSPFGVTVTPDGRYRYDVRVELARAAAGRGRVYVAWAVTPDLSQRKRIGVVGPDGSTAGQVDWNKFLILVTAEPSADVQTWSDPILMTAMSPSGRLETMAGEAIFGNNERPIQKRHCLLNKC